MGSHESTNNGTEDDQEIPTFGFGIYFKIILEFSSSAHGAKCLQVGGHSKFFAHEYKQRHDDGDKWARYIPRPRLIKHFREVLDKGHENALNKKQYKSLATVVGRVGDPEFL